MSSLALPEIDEKASELADDLLDKDPGCLQILGGVSVGKSTLLRRLKKQLIERGMRPLLVAPPAGALDVLSISLTQLASQLYNGEPSAKEVSDLLRSQTTKTIDKYRSLADWLSKGKEQFIVLCDDPASWQFYRDNYPGRSEKVSALFRMLLDVDGLRKVVTGVMPEGRRATQEYKAPPSSSPEDWLTSTDAWGSFLAEYANKLWNILGSELEKKTPLVIRLMVGLVALGEAPKKLVKLQRKDLAELLWQLSRADSALTELCHSWSALALIREGFRSNLLSVIGAPDETTTAGQLLRHCLLFKEDGQLILHEMLRSDAQTSVAQGDRKSIHSIIAKDYYLPLFADASKTSLVSEALTLEMEAYYHAAMSGQILDNLSPFFADQLNLLGRSLSEHEGRFKDASDVFARAIEWEPEDDYAHHYFAYNLDCLGERAQEVDTHYREAVRLRDDHPWWWSRLICFLLTRGRIESAETAWTDALDSLAHLYYSESTDTQVYSELHGHVLNNALYFNQLHFAERILKSIPKAVRQDDSHLRACQKRLDALKLANEGRAIVPMPYLKKGWWNDGPFRLFTTLDSGHVLIRWFAARVEAVSETVVELRLAEIPVDKSEEPEILLANFALEQLKVWALTDLIPNEGDYWEIGVYRRDENETYRLVVHDRVSLPEADEQLFRITPSPERYPIDRSY